MRIYHFHGNLYFVILRENKNFHEKLVQFLFLQKIVLDFFVKRKNAEFFGVKIFIFTKKIVYIFYKFLTFVQ